MTYFLTASRFNKLKAAGTYEIFINPVAKNGLAGFSREYFVPRD